MREALATRASSPPEGLDIITTGGGGAGGRSTFVRPTGGAGGQVLATDSDGQLSWMRPLASPTRLPLMKCGYCGTKSLEVITQCPQCAATTKLEMLSDLNTSLQNHKDSTDLVAKALGPSLICRRPPPPIPPPPRHVK